MYLALLLHIYQPPTQYRQMTRLIASRCYEKIANILKNNPLGKITLNINASLTEQLHLLKFHSLIADLHKLAQKEQIEFTGSAAYHPILPFLPSWEAKRQIKINQKVNQKFFGKTYQPKGFFPPEMAIDQKTLSLIKDFGFSWVTLDQTAYEPLRKKRAIFDRLFIDQKTKLVVMIRDNGLSLAIAFGYIKTLNDLKKALGPKIEEENFLILAMDGETFGHFRLKALKFLEELCKTSLVRLVTISELLEIFTQKKQIGIKRSTWGMVKKIGGKKVWLRWKNPANPLHRLQWQLTNLALEVSKTGSENTKKILDKAIHSDQYWWASHSPCWHPGMVERGTRLLEKVVLSSSQATNEEKQKAIQLADSIFKTGLNLYGRKPIAC